MVVLSCTACGADLEKVIRQANSVSKVTTLAPATEKELVMELAGNITSHALLDLSITGTFKAVVGYDNDAGRKLKRIAAGSPDDCRAMGESIVSGNQMNAIRSVFLYPGEFQSASGMISNGLYIRIRINSEAGEPLLLMIPYTKPPSGLSFGKPRFQESGALTEEEQKQMLTAFNRGIESFPEGAAIWSEHKDDTL